MNLDSLTQGSEMFSGSSAEDILKAIEAGSGTGRDYTDQINGGESLKVESLESVTKLLQYRMRDLSLWNDIPKETVYNTVNEYNQLVEYGSEVGISNLEGETPAFTDSQYKRKAATVAFMGIGGQVSHPAMLVKYADGKNALAREVENKTILLLKLINQGLSTNNSGLVSTQFSGIFQQHQEALIELAGLTGGTSAQKLDAYADDVVVIDARGKALSDDLVEEAMYAGVNLRYAAPSRILGAPIVFSNYVKRFHESKRVVPGINGSVEGATMGQSVNKIMTQFGAIDIMNDIFFDRKDPINYNAAATSDKAPAAITPDGTTPVAVATDATTKFTDGAGDYLYAVRAKNRYGLSAAAVLSATAITVAGTEAVDLKFAAGTGNYAADSFVIYRTKKDDVASSTAVQYFPIFEVAVTDKNAGYDGGAAGLVRDKNRTIANTNSAIVYEPVADVLKYIQLMPTMRMDFAINSPSRRFSVLNYGTPQLSMPGKIVRIVNLGDDLS